MKTSIAFLCLFFCGSLLTAQIAIPKWTDGDGIGLSLNSMASGTSFSLDYTHRFESRSSLRLGVHLLTRAEGIIDNYYSDFSISTFQSRLSWDLTYHFIIKKKEKKLTEWGPFFRLQYSRIQIQERYGNQFNKNSRKLENVLGLQFQRPLDKDSPIQLRWGLGIGLSFYEVGGNFSFGPFGTSDVYYESEFGYLLQIGLVYVL